MAPLQSGLLSLMPDRGEAIFAGKPLPLGEGDIALLHRLLERAGTFVAEEALAARPGPAGAARLRERVSGINEVLARHGDASYFVLHVPGLGYGVSLPGQPPSPALLAPLPRTSTRIVGQQAVIAQLMDKAARVPLLTIFGPGGIGKTTAAAEVARRLAPRFGDGVAFVDLAPLAQACSVPDAVAAALRMPAATALRAADLAAALASRHLLLVLDNCEHVVDVAAELCEAIQAHAPRCSVIATSRETLRCPGETVHRLPGLATPGAGEATTADAAMSFAAVELFALRAADRLGHFELCDADAPRLAALCRRLDGLPLAIELAAALVGRFTLEALAGLLETPHALQPDAAPVTARHASLGHMLAWSYELLEQDERRVFERLALFRGRFTLDSACAVAADDEVDAARVPVLVARLASKSLLVAQTGEEGPICRLLETTRAFALERLQASGEHTAISRRHALHMRALLRAANARRTELRADWLAQHGALIDDVRAALAWAFSAQGDGQIALRLTIDATPLGYQLTLWNEFFVLHERAIACLETLPDVEPAVELQLRTTHGEFVGHKLGPVGAMSASYDAALRIAQDHPETQLAAKARDGAWMGAFMSGDYPKAMRLVQQCVQDAQQSGDMLAGVRTDRMLAQTLHCMARHDEAAELATRLAHRPGRALHRPSDSAIDPRISARVVLARIAWLQGRADHAGVLLEEAHRMSEQDVPGSRAHVIVWGALPVAVWCGQRAQALQLLDKLEARCTTYQLPYWGTWIAGYAARLEPQRPRTGEFAAHDLKHLDMLATFGNAPVPAATLERAVEGTAPWCAPEVLRAHAETLLQGSAPRWDEAERLLRQSYALARSQGALAWELRSATSLARLWRHTGLALEAGELLSGTYARFHEGWDTADLASARQLLLQLQQR